MRRTSALCILIVAVACSRKDSTDRVAALPGRDASLQVVERSGAGTRDVATAADAPAADTPPRKQPANPAPMPKVTASGEGRGVELVPIDIGDAETKKRRPAEDWNKQLGGANPSEPSPKAGSGSGRVIVSSHRALDQTTLSSSRVVTEFLRRALPSVKQCYAKLLSNDPRAHGEMKLRFAVSETGGLVDGSAESWNADVSRCVRGLMPKWSFPVPQANGAPARSRFELGLDMKSE